MRTAIRVALECALLAFLLNLGQSSGRNEKHASGAVIAPRDNLLDPTPCVTWVTNGAQDGESLDRRLERLETAVRLSRAELYVNRRRK
jgi:hypothetical protein